MPVGISLLQTDVCYESLLIMNKEGIIGQYNNHGRGEEPAVGRLKLPFAISCTHQEPCLISDAFLDCSYH